MKFEFASPAWFEEAFRLFRETAREHPEVSFSVCEVFTHVPERLGPDADGRIAWHAFVKEGKAEVAFGELPPEAVDVKTIGEWEALLPAARHHIDLSDPEDLARFQAMTERLAAEGRVQRFGDRTKVPPVFVVVHNVLADRTA